MLNIFLSGCNGTMGQVIKHFVKNDKSIKIIGGFDKEPNKYINDFPVFNNLNEWKEKADVIIDFSHFSAFEEVINFARTRKIPLVMATTGLSKKNEDQLVELSKDIPVFRTANMSLGLNVILDLVRRASKILAETFDIEIIEKHHNKKVDAPSGTALMLAESIKSSLGGEMNFVFGRHTKEDNRGKNDIGIHAISCLLYTSRGIKGDLL